MDPQTNTYAQLTKEIFAENQNSEKLKNAGEAFRKIQMDYLTSLDRYLREKCANEFKWMDENSQLNDGQLIPKDKNNQEDFKKRTDELNECIKKHDNGITKPMEEFDSEYNKIQQNLSIDLSDCYKINPDLKEEIKKCLRKKINVGTDNLIEIFKKYEGIFGEIKNKINHH